MKLEVVAVFTFADLDYEHQTLVGFNVILLNAVDRVQVDTGSKRIDLSKNFFASADWFGKLVKMLH